MEQAVQLADQYWTANSRVPLQQSYLCPEPMEQAVQLADQYWPANSRGDRRGFRGFELMSAEGRPTWLGFEGSPAAWQKMYAARAWVTAARARRFRTGGCCCPQLCLSGQCLEGAGPPVPRWT